MNHNTSFGKLDMGRSAIASGLKDLFLPPAALGTILLVDYT